MSFKFINSFENLGEGFHSKTEVEAFDEPVMIHYNEALAEKMGLDLNKSEALKYFSGNKLMKNSSVISSVYAGHQFGSFVPQLGDGRAHYLGEIENTSTGKAYEIQLKGSGKTPYSRFGDGKAVLRSSIREYIASEALYHLGIPTTRALSLITSNEPVMREEMEPAAMVARVSDSFIRFGHFEFFTHTAKSPENTKKLADYVIEKFYPELQGKNNIYQKFFYRIVTSTAKLMAKWQAFGFTHGVMNTDNMSILGLTIDYGPYGFLDQFDPGYIPNHSDHTGRYSYMNQPQIAYWNLHALSYALEPILNPSEAGEILGLYKNILLKEYTNIMRKKLGFVKERESDEKLIEKLIMQLAGFEVDYTIFFHKLSEYEIDGEKKEIFGLFKKKDEIKEWLEKYEIRLKQEGWPDLNRDKEKANSKRQKVMKKKNPKYIVRNYMLQTAIKMAEKGDYSEITKLFNLLQKPFDEQAEYEPYAAAPPDWSKDICISCSS